MAGLTGFASHGGSILSRGWLATVEALGIPGTHLPLKRGSWLNLFLQFFSSLAYIERGQPFFLAF